MIATDLLRAKGTIEALLAISGADEPQSVGQLSEAMDLSDGTARQRLGDISDAGLITEDAHIVDDRPRRVYTPTEKGEELAEQLQTLLDDYETPETNEDDE